jgi:hypothetical protein
MDLLTVLAFRRLPVRRILTFKTYWEWATEQIMWRIISIILTEEDSEEEILAHLFRPSGFNTQQIKTFLF